MNAPPTGDGWIPEFEHMVRKLLRWHFVGCGRKVIFFPQSSFEFVERKDNSKDYYCFFKCDRLCVAVGNVVLFLLTFLPNSLSFPVGKCFLCSG